MNYRIRRALRAAAVLLLIAAGETKADGETINARTDLELYQLPKKYEVIDKAIDSFQKRDYEQCLKLLKEAATKNKELFPARLMMAKLFLLHNQQANGRANLEQVAAENPELPETYLVFGRLALGEGRLTDAGLHFERALLLSRSEKWTGKLKQMFQIDAHMGMASVAERRRDWPAALAVLTAWLEKDPHNGITRQRLGRVLFRQGKRDKAYQELQRAVKDVVALEPAAITMGQLFTEEKNLSEAEEWMERAVRETPRNAKARAGFATWLLHQNRPNQAKAQIHAAAELDPKSSDVKFLRGLIAWHLREYAAAEQILQKLHAEIPGSFSISNQLALALVEQRDEDKRLRARQFADINVRLYPNSGEALTTLGLVLYRQGQWQQAEQALRAGLSKGNATSDSAYYLARVLWEHGRSDEAKELLKLALDAPGRFTFRKEAQEKFEQISKK